jgi:hypothetical protein
MVLVKTLTRASDYPQAEYSVSTPQMERFVKRIDAEIRHEATRGKIQVFTGKLPRRRTS